MAALRQVGHEVKQVVDIDRAALSKYLNNQVGDEIIEVMILANRKYRIT